MSVDKQINGLKQDREINGSTAICLILVLLFCSLFPTEAGGTGEPDVTLDFLRERIELPEAASFFNVVRIVNSGQEEFNGVLRISRPDGWNLMGEATRDISLGAGQELLVPLRISMPGGARGNVAYIISAELQAENKYLFRNSYVSLAPVRAWDMSVDRNEVFLSEFRPASNFNVRLTNRGNVEEMVRLRFRVGGLIQIHSLSGGDSLVFVDIPPYSDTTLRIDVTARTGLPWSEQRLLERNWQASTIYLNAMADEKELFAGIRATTLKSSYYNESPYLNSPLNLDVNMFNLLSAHSPRMTGRLHGRLIFPGDQMLNYNIGVNNIHFNHEANRGFDIYRNIRYNVRYNDRYSSVRLSDRISTGGIHSLSGIGAAGIRRFGDNAVSAGLAYNPYSDNYGINGGFSTLIGRVAANTGATMEMSANDRFRHYSVYLGGGFSFAGNHTLRMEAATSLSSFAANRYSAADTSVVGLGYRIGYNYRGARFNMRINNYNTEHTFLRNSGINRTDGNFRYILSDQTRLQAYYNRRSYTISRYPYNFYFDRNSDLNENSRLYLSYRKGNVVYQLGPQYFRTVRHNYNPYSGLTTRYRFHQPGIMASATFRLDTYRSVTPNFSFNAMNFDYSPAITDGQGEGSSSLWNWQYTAGISYYSNDLKLSAYYTSGESSDLYRSAVIGGEPSINQAIHLRPYYERYLARETVRLSGYMNYSYYMPSQRESVMANIGADFFLGRGRSIFASFNLYRTTRNDSELGSITSRDLNMMFGLRIAFDVQQLNVRHHNLRIAGFNDQDGDGIRGDRERPVPDILVNLARDPMKNEYNNTGFAEINMITNELGEIFYSKIPEGVYDLTLNPLSGSGSRFFLHGDKQVLTVTNDTLFYLPLIESNSIRGRILMDRDPNSTEGRISLDGIRVMAESADGSSYSTLTAGNGSFVLNVPAGPVYTVSIINVFGERFMLERGEYELQFGDSRIVEVDFVFREIRRQIEFREGEELFRFNIRPNN